ncbi:glycosyl transferase family 2 [Erwinia persicina]|uniref:glycosyltransferase family 2 protein n=1 Tax=Erwinia persicina TaxID=55211 RepID=UPI000E4D4760|nr:glycosyltransferase family 2 protein [Erwinia persicina]AXU94488.1 glycosyl transferase family 2 [Erwinia persicina]MBC3946942.1 glycosyltransferase family 2 protein [Erwinia persicina]MCQ4093257.1 glycosyltransferase family 2 protein [Erwinia persicina]MCQ4099025.1 glycosyltransferase family 2 protein [Erwinia persicina]
MQDNRISLLVNTLNERDNILKNIIPVSIYFDELVIVDMSSDDGSKDVVSDISNARFIETDKRGYVEPARKLGIDSCKYEYVFILDADEILSAKLLNVIKLFRSGNITCLENVKNGGCLYFPRLNSMFGRDITWGKFSPDHDRQLRFFNKKNVIVTDVIHKGLVPAPHAVADIIKFESEKYIYHYHSTSALQFISRLVRYAEFENNKKTGEDSFSITPAVKAFIREFILAKGFLHGRIGFTLAYILALREFLKGR